MLAWVACISLTGAGVATQPPITVVDGDTVDRAGVRYRLTGYDTPEMRGRCPAETALARTATARLRALIAAAHTVDLRGTGARDHYGRMLAALVLDGRDVGETLISEGLAREYQGVVARPPEPRMRKSPTTAL